MVRYETVRSYGPAEMNEAARHAHDERVRTGIRHRALVSYAHDGRVLGARVVRAAKRGAAKVQRGAA